MDRVASRGASTEDLINYLCHLASWFPALPALLRPVPRLSPPAAQTNLST